MAAIQKRATNEHATPAPHAAPPEGTTEAAKPSTVVLPRRIAAGENAPGAQDARALQRIIEDSFALLDKVAEESGTVPMPVLVDKKSAGLKAKFGAAAGSEIRYRSSISSRVYKTVGAIALVLVVGLVPLQRMLAPVSTEAFVNAPIYSVQAPVGGRLGGRDIGLGERVTRDAQLATIEDFSGLGEAASVSAPVAGKIWDVLVQPGGEVVAGQEIVRVVACSAASVTASVSETVYYKLSPGMPARFSFFGGDRFYEGSVANLLGHSDGPVEHFAIPPANLKRDTYRVIVTVPDLGTIPDCAVGKPGKVLFEPPTRSG